MTPYFFFQWLTEGFLSACRFSTSLISLVEVFVPWKEQKIASGVKSEVTYTFPFQVQGSYNGSHLWSVKTDWAQKLGFGLPPCDPSQPSPPCRSFQLNFSGISNSPVRPTGTCELVCYRAKYITMLF